MFSSSALPFANMHNAGADFLMSDLEAMPDGVAHELLTAPHGSLVCDGRALMRRATQTTDAHVACCLAAEGLRLIAQATGYDAETMRLASSMSYKAEMSAPGRMKHVSKMLDRRS